jgi:aminopeptidase N
MLNVRHILPVFAAVLISCSGIKSTSVVHPERGVSQQLANHRKEIISKVHYQLELDIPAQKDQKIGALEKISFELKSKKYSLHLDFKEDPAKLKSIVVNGVSIELLHVDEHIIIGAKYLKTGENVVDLEFTAGDGALNRNSDYLYTLFVPDRARTVFPCFDQPDLKAVYTLTLKVPADWKAIANGGLKDSTLAGARKTYHFKTSDTISTYLFAFAAGKFKSAKGEMDHLQANFLYRETDTAKINHSLNEVFKIHGSSLKFLEDWTGIPYPFQKFDFVSIPDFQFGGMEHVGAIQYK